jgi:hypothetical protein
MPEDDPAQIDIDRIEEGFMSAALDRGWAGKEDHSMREAPE